MSRHEIDNAYCISVWSILAEKFSNKWEKGYTGSWQKEILAQKLIPRPEPDCRPITPWMKGHPGSPKEEPW